MAKEQEIMTALRDVIDPEIGINVVDLGLIREIRVGGEETEIRMILTTPFCPLAGWITEQVRLKTESVVGGPAKVTLLDERWDPSMMQV
ncbi:MAG: metal-sulfur cluster assembly factor [Anaerolineae bacterium]